MAAAVAGEMEASDGGGNIIAWRTALNFSSNPVAILMVTGISASDHLSLAVGTVYQFYVVSPKKKCNTHLQAVHNSHIWGPRTFGALRSSHISSIVLISEKESAIYTGHCDLHTVRTSMSTFEVHASIALQRQQVKSSLTSVLKWRAQPLQLTKRGAMGDTGGRKT